MYFCNLSRMFQVGHVTQFRGFNNNSVYYKLILKKHNQKANVQPDIVVLLRKYGVPPLENRIAAQLVLIQATADGNVSQTESS